MGHRVTHNDSFRPEEDTAGKPAKRRLLVSCEQVTVRRATIVALAMHMQV
ncbi:MAG: hypothetical protein QNJ19_03735 [Woeseiaceae bacterium]|nr:hypothetical protein [Woeseiaceae bacterium]